ncbi:MAG: helix-turn-helix transcriptional regulator [Flavobacterium sp.]|uniref:helix-turn-helix domain-containing protein n=1 Tax=Flavobacterium sp. TaxID=239 RepID=UPI002FCA0EB2
MKSEGNMITNWLDQYGDPEIERFVEKNLAITEKIRFALEQKGWKALDLAKALDKSPSEVSKWLTGMHNLTLKSITKLETVLGLDLISVEPIKEIQYVYLGTIKGGELEQSISDYEDSTYEREAI